MSEYQGRAIRLRTGTTILALSIPLICVPVSIDNNLPGTDTEFGADTAPTTITDAIDQDQTVTH